MVRVSGVMDERGLRLKELNQKVTEIRDTEIRDTETGDAGEAAR